MSALNLRAGNTQIPGPVYSGSYAWGSDVATYTAILSLFNPSTAKTINIMGITVGGWNSANAVRAITFNICRSTKSSSGTTVNPVKFDSNDLVASASLEAGGSWTLGDSLKIVTCAASSGQSTIPIELEAPLTLGYNESLSIVFITESGKQVFYPNASITWYEV